MDIIHGQRPEPQLPVSPGRLPQSRARKQAARGLGAGGSQWRIRAPADPPAEAQGAAGLRGHTEGSRSPRHPGGLGRSWVILFLGRQFVACQPRPPRSRAHCGPHGVLRGAGVTQAATVLAQERSRGPDGIATWVRAGQRPPRSVTSVPAAAGIRRPQVSLTHPSPGPSPTASRSRGLRLEPLPSQSLMTCAARVKSSLECRSC